MSIGEILKRPELLINHKDNDVTLQQASDQKPQKPLIVIVSAVTVDHKSGLAWNLEAGI